ncbi:TraB/GumN family protein [Sphingorhabdus sp. Alg239-R122]|uniref:TraB/GumN family protein n=1 Tax=Sphingorhabdus sp. Alg239-R122 TaxID=2305989 RepID=UPI001967523C|nr:TraB/GumN family protein [Sphingorhabdus sp. Alg239-R122]
MAMLHRLILPIFTAVFLTACGQSANTAPVDIVQPDDPSPALWEISSKGQPSYLFGTVHILPENIAWQDNVVDAAIARADHLILELDPAETPERIGDIFTVMATTPGQPPLKNRIDTDLHDEAADIMQEYSLPASLFANVESWGAALMISSSLSGKTGARGEFGVEEILTSAFRKNGRHISGLESATQQFGYFDGLSESDQRAMLEAVIDGADESAANYKRLLESWLTGDTKMLETILAQGFDSRPSIRKAVVTARNRDWAEQIAGKLESGGSIYFIAVGAGHFTGPDSLQKLLTEKGYTVKRLQ